MSRRKRNRVDRSKDDLLIGRARHLYYPDQEENVYLSTRERSQHGYIIGGSGTGKTQLLVYLIRQLIQAFRGFGFIDVHGDATDIVLGFIAKLVEEDGSEEKAQYVSQKLVLVEPSSPEWVVGFNPLELKGVDPSSQTTEFMGIFKKLWADVHSFGARSHECLQNSVYTVSVNGMTLLELKPLLINPEFRDRLVSKLPDGEIKEYWLFRYNCLSAKMQAMYREPLLNRLSIFLSDPTIRAMIGQTKSTIDFRDIMDREKWLLVNLSKGRLKGNADLLGALIVAKIQLAALSRADIPESRRIPFTLFVDEFQNLASQDFQTILSEARKYGLALVLAHQNLEQVDQQLRAAILANTRTQIFFRLSDRDASTLASEISHREKAIIQRRLIDLKTREAYFKKKGERPRLMKTFYISPPKVTAKEVKLVKKLSFATYGRPRKDVEEEITSRMHTIYAKGNAEPARKGEVDPDAGRFAPTGDFEESEEW